MFYVIVYVYFSYKLVVFFFLGGGGVEQWGGGVSFMCYSAGATHVHIF